MKRTMRVLAAAAVSLCAGILILTVSAATDAEALVSAGAGRSADLGLSRTVFDQGSVKFQQVKKTKAERKAKREAKRNARKERRAARKAKRSQQPGQAQQN